MTTLEIILLAIGVSSTMVLSYMFGYYRGTNDTVFYYTSALKNLTKSATSKVQDEFDRKDDSEIYN